MYVLVGQADRLGLVANLLNKIVSIINIFRIILT
jgi:hypothetical protein